MTQEIGCGTPSVTVVERIAEREGVDPLGLTPPLYDVIDPDALDQFCTGATAGAVVAFSYRGYDVTVTAGGIVSLERRAYDSAAEIDPASASTAGAASD